MRSFSCDPFKSGSVPAKLCFCAFIPQNTASFPASFNVTALFWLTRPTGADANNNYNRTACHSVRQGWILPSDLSSLLSQEQSPSVIMRYGEWWLICFCAAILGELFPPSNLKSLFPWQGQTRGVFNSQHTTHTRACTLRGLTSISFNC